MTGIYSTARICPYKNQNCDLKKDGLGLEPGMHGTYQVNSYNFI